MIIRIESALLALQLPSHNARLHIFHCTPQLLFERYEVSPLQHPTLWVAGIDSPCSRCFALVGHQSSRTSSTLPTWECHCNDDIEVSISCLFVLPGEDLEELVLTLRHNRSHQSSAFFFFWGGGGGGGSVRINAGFIINCLKLSFLEPSWDFL